MVALEYPSQGHLARGRNEAYLKNSLVKVPVWFWIIDETYVY